MRVYLIALCAAFAASAQQPLSAEQAKALVPRVDLSNLTDQQRAEFVAVASDVMDYAGCAGTLAACLAADQKDPHALRMATLIKQFISEGFPAQAVTGAVEKYYASFD